LETPGLGCGHYQGDHDKSEAEQTHGDDNSAMQANGKKESETPYSGTE
jgi:hypothetical protein